MSGFDLSDYVTVDERIRLFIGKHPDGTLQGEGEFVRDDVNNIIGYVYKAQAFRSPEDPRPGVGTAYEPIPGTTPYTRNSEVMNAETSAWGRAIVAAGIPSRKIASQEEVRNRQDAPAPAEQRNGKTKPELLAYLSDILVALNTQAPGTQWTERARSFSKDNFQTVKSQELTKPQLQSLVGEAEKWLAHLEAEEVPFG